MRILLGTLELVERGSMVLFCSACSSVAYLRDAFAWIRRVFTVRSRVRGCDYGCARAGVVAGSDAVRGSVSLALVIREVAGFDMLLARKR